MRPRLPFLALLLVAPLLGACSGRPCGDLPALTAERDAARAAYARLVEPGTAPPEVTAEADDDVHVLDRRVYELEQACRDR